MEKILIADDHCIVRTGIGVLVNEEFLNPEIDECKDGNGVLEKLRAGRYDLLILDIHMPGTNTVNLLQTIFSLYPDLKVLILTISREEIYAKAYLQLGVKGFINKEADFPELRAAIRTSYSNKRYLSPKIKDLLAQDSIDAKPANPLDSLSPREREVMGHLIEGKNISQIAQLLSTHISTISTHKAKILEKMCVTNMIELKEKTQLFRVMPDGK
jgi:DNA-binding NarL/FixJ family response regulator